MNPEPEIRRQIAQRVAAISSTADLFPGLVSVLNLRTWGIEYMSARGLRALGTTLPALQAAGAAYPRLYLHAHDAAEYGPRLLALRERNDDEDILSFFQQVRTAEPPAWSWHLSSLRIFLRDEQGAPLLALAFACPLNALSHVTPKVARLLEETTFLRRHQALFDQLTPREREVLRLLALGKNSAAIAAELFISLNTAITHRRNINAKLHPATQRDLTRYAYAYDLV